MVLYEHAGFTPAIVVSRAGFEPTDALATGLTGPPRYLRDYRLICDIETTGFEPATLPNRHLKNSQSSLNDVVSNHMYHTFYAFTLPFCHVPFVDPVGVEPTPTAFQTIALPIRKSREKQRINPYGTSAHRIYH